MDVVVVVRDVWLQAFFPRPLCGCDLVRRTKFATVARLPNHAVCFYALRDSDTHHWLAPALVDAANVWHVCFCLHPPSLAMNPHAHA